MEVAMAKARITRLFAAAILTFFTITEVGGSEPEQGIFNKLVTITHAQSGQFLYEGFTKSMFKDSEVGLSIMSSGCNHTTKNAQTKITISWMLRYSECEGVYALSNESASSSLATLFEEPGSAFPGEKVVKYYKTKHPVTKLCADLNGPIESDEVDEVWPELFLTPTNAPKSDAKKPEEAADKNKGDGKKEEKGKKQKRAAEEPPADKDKKTQEETPPEDKKKPVTEKVDKTEVKDDKKATDKTADKTATSKTTKAPKSKNLLDAPLQRTPLDGRYIFIVRIEATDVDQKENVNLELKVQMISSKGYLSAFQWPLLPFYGVMCGVYSVLAFIWLLLLGCNWRDLLRIQFWICGVLILGLLEKAIFYAEYEHVNKNGVSVMGAIVFAELMSCLKRALARMLLIIVSLGYGITRPRLGRDLHWVMAAGSAYFILSSVEGCLRVKGQEQHALIAVLPLAVLDAVICWWIFKNLVDTTRQLRLRRNLTKLWLYRHVTNTLIVCIVCAVVFLIWSTKAHRWAACLTKWRELWLDDAYWHVLFCIILTVIMVLVRPTANNQRYAFSPLVDVIDDEESQQPMISDAYDTVKMRQIPNDRSSSGKSAADDALKWVEDNIPAAVADAALAAFDDSEEELVNTLERNKME